MKKSNIKSIIIAIIIMLFAICIPNYSKAATFMLSGRYDATQPRRTNIVDGIYRAMRQYGDAWLDTYPTRDQLRSTGWEYWPVDDRHNGYLHSMVWSTGATCIGHGQQGSGGLTSGSQRRIAVIDIGDNNTDKEKDAWLAYAILYATSHNEHDASMPLSTKGLWGTEAIMTWIERFKIPGFHAQLGHPTGGFNDKIRYYSSYGGQYVGNVYYSSAQEYVNSRDWKISLNTTQMNNDAKNGTPTKVFWRDEQTLIGPYRLDILGKVSSITMNYVDINGRTQNVSPQWYCTTEEGELLPISNLTSFSSINKIYLVFNGKMNIKKINSITLSQAKGTIKARLVASESGGSEQNLAIFYGRGKSSPNTISLPVPPPTVVVPIKKDKDNGAILTNARFVLKNLDTGKYVVGGLNSMAAQTGWSDTIEGATSYKTGDNIILDKAGRYQFYEVQAHSRFYKQCSKTEEGKLQVGDPFTMNIGNSINVQLQNQPRGYIKIQKQDDTTKKELNNTRFIIKKQNAEEYAKGGLDEEPATWTTNIKEATWYEPKQEVCFEQKIICQIYEVQRESESYEYCSIDQPLKVGNPVQIKYREIVTAIVNNRRKYIKISGYVWEDLTTEGKETEYDDLYDTQIAPDKKVANVKVELKDASGNILQTRVDGPAVTITKENTGEYNFKEIEIEKLKDGAYLEFTYNGMAYKSVKLNPGLENGSKATDEVQREEYNNKFEKIERGKAIGKQGDISINYEKSDNESTLDFEGGKYGYQDQKYPVSETAKKYEITANTKTNGFLGQTDHTLNDIYIKGLDEMDNINLGIVERAMPDMSVVKDLNNAKVNINGKEHIYNYADRFKPELYEQNGGNGYDLSPQVKYASKYSSMSYTRALYSSDVHYKEQEEGDPLRVHLTYKIGIKNASKTLVSVINEIDDYYDAKFEINPEKITIGKEIEANGDVKETSKLNYEFVESRNDQYYKIKIKDMNLEIAPQEEGHIYVQLEVKEEQIVEILKEGTKLDNVAEISSYSNKENGKIYAGIDKDSEPGNIQIGDTKTYEDDTDKAPGIMLVLQEERKLEGKVFIDSTSRELRTGQIRQADGTYKDGEAGVTGVTVTLIDTKTKKIANKYNEAKETWEIAQTTTDENGDYYIGGIIPNEYKIIYTWGGQKYQDTDGQEKQITVQDYKGTIYQNKERQNNIEWYKEREPRYSDAIDNYDENQNLPKGSRKQIDNQTNIITNANKKAINNLGGEIELENGEKVEIITQMDSTTPNFRVNIEYSTNQTDSSQEYELEDGKIKMNGPYVVKTKEHSNYLQNIDFGIVERARQALALEKVTKNAKLVAANGSILSNVIIKEDSETGERTLEDTVRHVVYIPKDQDENGQIKFEIDNEIIQGAKLEVEYGLKVTNISELDYINKDYYIYGQGKEYTPNNNEIVTLKANNIIDYIDNGLATNKDINQTGEVLQNLNDKMELIKKGLLGEELKDTVKSTNRILLMGENNNNTENPLLKELKPQGTVGESTAQINIKGSKLLANNEENLLDNNAEIIKVSKTGGSSLITIPRKLHTK